MRSESFPSAASVLCLGLLIAPSHSQAANNNISGRYVVISELRDSSINLVEGFNSVISLDFIPSTVLLGDPKVVDMVVIEGGANSHINLVGIAPGTTSLIILDSQHKPRVTLEVSVVRQVAYSRRAIGDASHGEVSSEKLEEISVYRGTALSDVICSSGRCEQDKEKK
jgi:Flp pilus assembly secretin CpaC